MYEVEVQLKERMRAVKLTTRDLAKVLGQPPGTISGRLNGFLPLASMERRIILAALEEAERREQE